MAEKDTSLPTKCQCFTIDPTWSSYETSTYLDSTLQSGSSRNRFCSSRESVIPNRKGEMIFEDDSQVYPLYTALEIMPNHGYTMGPVDRFSFQVTQKRPRIRFPPAFSLYRN